jgi:hypothetical protein
MAKSYWLDRNGKFHPCPNMGHGKWAEAFLKTEGATVGINGPYVAMYQRKFVRVTTERRNIYFSNHATPPTVLQMRRLTDMAIESQMRLIDPMGREVELF